MARIEILAMAAFGTFAHSFIESYPPKIIFAKEDAFYVAQKPDLCWDWT